MSIDEKVCPHCDGCGKVVYAKLPEQPVQESKPFDGIELYAKIRECVEYQPGADETAQKILNLVWPHISTKRESGSRDE